MAGKNSSMYLGVDIASVDGNKPIDWTKAKAAGVRFAIFRGTYKTWEDPTWKQEADRARAEGIVVGAYLFPVMDKSAPSAEEQVVAFAKACGTAYKLGDLPPTLDVEFPGGIAKTGRTREELLEWIKSAVAALKQSFGIWPMIYTSARVWDGEDTDSLNADATGFLDCPLWLARYVWATKQEAHTDASTLALPPVPHAWGAENVWIHQYQGDAIHLPGFTATEDLNRFFDLRKGSQGARVKWLQAKLKINVDGDFGDATENAVFALQRVNGLVPDGVVGPRTFAYACWIK